MCPIASSSLPLTQPSQSSSHRSMQQRLGCGVDRVSRRAGRDNELHRSEPSPGSSNHPDPCESTDYHPTPAQASPPPPSLPPSAAVDPTVTILLARPFPLAALPCSRHPLTASRIQT
ncbi:hypothetical protein TcWFU_002100 [Taenia crassiceps]|uniref:Uncharacterized protein n=1 Tax=Taenia crassiceps TaxID=6207 RepID=A0ABR4PZ37_9CEST